MGYCGRFFLIAIAINKYPELTSLDVLNMFWWLLGNLHIFHDLLVNNSSTFEMRIHNSFKMRSVQINVIYTLMFIPVVRVLWFKTSWFIWKDLIPDSNSPSPLYPRLSVLQCRWILVSFRSLFPLWQAMLLDYIYPSTYLSYIQIYIS